MKFTGNELIDKHIIRAQLDDLSSLTQDNNHKLKGL